MDTVETASRKVKQMGRQIESSMGNLKNMMSSISLVGDAKHFQEGKGKFDELRTKLDSKSDKGKLDAMKTLVAMMTLGRDVSELFPAVVKNVVVESMEIKKLVYMYVIHYAATNPNLALLSISSFQKDMASPNPLVRAKALHAMSCMRVSSVAHLIILQLKNAIKDSSPYVRRTAGHVLPSVLLLDAKFKVDLIAMLTTLLADDDVYVLSGALYAFNILCGDKFDLIHPNYRKICHLLADMDEYGQVVALSILMRYCRNQFKSPFLKDKKTEEGEDENKDKDAETKRDDGDSDDDDLLKSLRTKTLDDDDDEFVELDPDHKLLIVSCKNLIFSMNSQVVLSVVCLLYYCAPKNECLDAIRALIQFINYSKREICYVILANVSTMASERSELFAGFYKDFYIKSIEAGCIKELKLDILSKIATDSNINHILHEFEAYAKDPDIKFRCSTIEAMGRCCSMIPDVAEKTMSLLMSLLSPSNQSPDVVASSVVVIRQIIQRNPSNYEKSMIKLLKLLQKTNVPAARCAIVWIIGEYRQYISDYAPDALRILAKKFVHEALEVKVQILNLAVKVYLADPKKTILLFKYILDLCKYDQNYDLRDKARMIRCIFFQKKKKKGDPLSPAPVSADVQRQLRTKMQEMFLSEKKVPEIISPFKERDRFVMNTLSHMVLHSVGDNYLPLEEFPEIPPDNAEKRTPADSSDDAWKRTLSGTDNKKTPKGEGDFFDSDVQEFTSSGESESDSEDTDSDDSDGSDTESDSDDSDDSDSESDSEDEDESDAEESESESEQERKKKKQKEAAQRKKQQEQAEKLKAQKKKTTKKEESESEEDEDEEEEEESEEEPENESSSEEMADVLVASSNKKDTKGKDDKKETEEEDESSKKKRSKVTAVKSVESEEESDEDESEEEVAVSSKSKKKGKKDKKSKGKKGAKKEEKAKAKTKETPQAEDLLGGLFGDIAAKSEAAVAVAETTTVAATSGGGGGGDTFDMFDMLGGGGAPAAIKKPVVSEEDEEKEKEKEVKPAKKSKKKEKSKKGKKKKQESSEDEESGWSDSDEDEEDEEEEEAVSKKAKKKKSKSPPKVPQQEQPEQKEMLQDVKKQKEKQRSDQLSDLFSSVMGNTVNVAPASNMDIMGTNDILFGASADSLVKKETNVGFKGELLNHTHTTGLQIDYEFMRQQSRYGVRFNQIRLIFENKWDKKMKGISLSPHNLDKSQQDYRDIFDGGIAELDAGERKVDYIHVQFGKTSEMRFDINVEEGTNKKRYTAKIKGIPGELMRPNTSYSMDEFLKIKASSGAMSERNLNCDLPSLDEAAKQILKTFHIGIINSAGSSKNFNMNEQRYFSGYLLADDSDVLIALEKQANNKIMCTIHCTEFMLIDAITEVARQCLSAKK
eukprot:CAMPEP_0197037556 /NCGR_PEP_ID=MMETSP1384-20130603/14733_1 /TAXON_ID=29189 /ORGANISM="Ammonia sp." /LENGTH=1385 /DNA_ID=CAMNT_0042467871 /DNA_START=77 /DNA_END=4234 /DNA_ORIENTATION=+